MEVEVQTAPLPVTSSRGSSPARGTVFTKVSLGASPHYELLRRRRPAPSEAIPLSCEGHSFFGDLPHVEEFVRAFYDKLFSVEGDLKIT